MTIPEITAYVMALPVEWSPLDETRAALIAHMIHKETTNETDRDSYRS